jgi:hypothetical protein
MVYARQTVMMNERSTYRLDVSPKATARLSGDIGLTLIPAYTQELADVQLSDWSHGQ